MSELIDVSHISRRGSSLRITVPKKVAEEMKVGPESIIGFYKQDGRLYIKAID